MREKNRKPIANNRKKLPQFTTMNVIDGQAGLVNYSSLIFYSLTIDNILNIIVLLILAAVSIATLTGQNGILTRANEAKKETGQATAKEKVGVEVLGSYDNNGNISIEKLNENLKNVTGLTSGLPIEFLPATVEVDGYEIMIGDNGNTGTIIRMPEYQTENTKPYLPSNNFSQVEDTNLDNGLVITDGTNNWVWIEVPKSIYTTAKSENDYETIENDMETYTETLVTRDGYEDVWYDGEGKTAEESTNLNDVTGCGLTYEEYNNLKKYMLSSIYKNGGFWVGQYEAGANSYPATKENDTRKVVIQKGAYPYNYITCSNAQKKSREINSGNYTSSLMFGIQWDLILKYLQNHGTESSELIISSKNWGNYKDSNFILDNGRYTINPNVANAFEDYNKDTLGYIENSNKLENTVVLVTTGACENNKKMNIYDLAGNVTEWTLERAISNPRGVLTSRGSIYSHNGSNEAASYRLGDGIKTYDNYYGFRIAIY